VVDTNDSALSTEEQHMILPAPQTTVFVVEQYLPQPTEAAVDLLASALGAAAAAATLECTAVRLVQSLLIRDDDLCLHILTAASLEAVANAAGTAGITPERIMTATLWRAA
jgi:hypothetical protein